MPQTISVPWQDEPLEFPDNATPDEITDAVYQHPSYPGNASWGNNSFANAGRQVNDFMGEVTKGLPVLGGALQPDDNDKERRPGKYANTLELNKFEHEHPGWSTAGNVVGNIGGTAAALAAAPELEAPALLDKLGTGGKYIMDALNYGTQNSALNSADTLARKGKQTTMGDIGSDIGTGYATGALAPAIAKGISPGVIPDKYLPYKYLKGDQEDLFAGTPHAPELKPSSVAYLKKVEPDEYNDLLGMAKQARAKEVAAAKAQPISPGKQAVADALGKIGGGIAGGVYGNEFGGPLGMAAGAVLGGISGKELSNTITPYIAKALHGYGHNQVMGQNSSTALRYLLSALGQGANRPNDAGQ